jgi:hypothetical protein
MSVGEHSVALLSSFGSDAWVYADICFVYTFYIGVVVISHDTVTHLLIPAKNDAVKVD